MTLSSVNASAVANTHSGVGHGGVSWHESMEACGRMVEKMLHSDSQCPSLGDKLRCHAPGSPSGLGAGLSGNHDPDYPAVTAQSAVNAAALRAPSQIRRVPLPAELVEHFGHMQCNCLMGVFPGVGRAWLTIDSDIYLWRFEDGGDLAYFDGLGDTILSVAWLTPRVGVFKDHIKYLLCLTTAVEIVLLGVTFGPIPGHEEAEMHLLPEPLFTLATDAVYMMCIAGTAHGRIFMGGKDGCLYEFVYQAEDGWFGKKAQKINHSNSSLSFLVPSFINAAFYEEDPIEQIQVDESRHILYTRSEKGNIQVFDLGPEGRDMVKVVAVSQASIVQEAARVAIHIDQSNLTPIIGISVVPMSESPALALVAVSGNGVRFYFSVMGNNLMGRPQNLYLQHVRLPPGFSAASNVPRPSKAHMSYYNQGTLLLVCSQTEESDMLWLLSNDGFPFQNILMEGQTSLPLDGRVWALGEIPGEERMLRLYKDSFQSMQPPLVVIQHTQIAKRFVLISAQGTIIVSKLRPVDHLRQLLIDHGGPDNEVVKGFFSLHADAQGIATSLILACSRAIQDRQISEWATRAFFLYGGEPRLSFGQQAPNQAGNQAGRNVSMAQPFSPSFHPHIASTPAPHNQSAGNVNPFLTPRGDGGFGSQSMFQPELIFSSKHNGLYLYFSRLVRPLWLATLVVPGSQTTHLASTLTIDEIEWVLTQLCDLKEFMDRNSHMHSGSSGGVQASMSLGHPHHPHHPGNHLHKSHQEALLKERQSLLFLQQLVSHCQQVIGLWKVVCDHQVHVVAQKLGQDEQNILRGMYFRDLILSNAGKELSSRLVQAIINLYLADNASTDAISNRLREVCPALYNTEDAISSKAHEMLITAKSKSNPNERERLLRDAVNMCKDIASRVNLDVLTSHLAAVHCYWGVVEVCLAAANRRDPQGLALHYYKKSEPMEDQQGHQAFVNRMNCYKHVLEILRRLIDTGRAHPMSPSVPKAPGPPPPADPNQLPPQEASEYAENVFQLGLQSEDQLFHIALYQWLVDHNQFDRLLSIRSSFLEDYLTRGTKRSHETVLMFDLLWKYYEKARSYAAAARILAKLAERHTVDVALQQRLEYLSRAIMCVKSGEVNGESSRGGVGELLHDLEEKMEVARVQLQILDSLNLMDQASPSPNLKTAIDRLNADLLDISQLYQDFAEPYELWECQLAILHCSGHQDKLLVETVWEHILEKELRQSQDLTNSSRIPMIANKLKALGTLYASAAQRYFPLEFIVRKLEVFSCQIQSDHTWVFKTLLNVSIPIPKVLEVYNRLYLANEPVWLRQGSPHHLLYVLARLLDTFASSPSMVSYNERRQFVVTCLDAVGKYLSNLYTKHDSNLLVSEFKAIQAKLERL